MATRITLASKNRGALPVLKSLVAFSLALLCLMWLAPAPQAAVAAEPATLRFSVLQDFKRSGNAVPPGDVFSYRLTPGYSAQSMPDGSAMGVYDFAIRGSDAYEIGPIYYYQEGIYIYELRQVTPLASGYTLDEEVYTLEVHVSRDLQVVLLAYKSNGYKATNLIFTNYFVGNVEVTPTPEPGPGPGVTPGPGPGVTPGPAGPTGPSGPSGPAPASPTIVVPNPGLAPLVPVPESNTDNNQAPHIQEPERQPDLKIDELLEDQSIPTLNIFGLEIPLIGGHENWALLNFLLCILGFIVTLIALVRALNELRERSDSPRVHRQKLGYRQSDSGNSLLRSIRNRRVWLSVAVAATVVNIIVLFITEDFTKAIALVDLWTLINAALLILAIAAVFLASKQAKRLKT